MRVYEAYLAQVMCVRRYKPKFLAEDEKMTTIEAPRSNSIHKRTIAMLWFFCLLIESIPVELDNGLANEYCTTETFQASCEDNEVILMQTAFYGRMRLGRCIQKSYDDIGCRVNALEIVDGRCSGRRRCEIQVPDKELHNISTCTHQLVMYLEASFICLPVRENIPSKCSSSIALTLTENSGYISHSHSSGHKCFWTIRLPVGLRVNVTLLDFGVSRHKKTSGFPGGIRPLDCYMYAYIKETSQVKARICSGLERERVVYLSETNSIEVETLTIRAEKTGGGGGGGVGGGGGEKSGIVGAGGIRNVEEESYTSDSDGIRYLLKYEAVGCADIEVTPGHMIVHRPEKDKLFVSCDNRTKPHQLICREKQWIGNLPVCSQHSSHNESSSGFWSKLTSDWAHAILVTVAIGMTLGIIIGVALLVVLMAYLKRRERHTMLREQTASLHHHQQQQQQQQLHPPHQTQLYSRSILSSCENHDQVQIYYERPRGATDAESKFLASPGEFMQDSWLLMGQADDVICSCPAPGKLLASPGNRITERQNVENQFTGRQGQQMSTEHVYELTC